jgi:hypothetical protein
VLFDRFINNSLAIIMLSVPNKIGSPYSRIFSSESKSTVRKTVGLMIVIVLTGKDLFSADRIEIG